MPHILPPARESKPNVETGGAVVKSMELQVDRVSLTISSLHRVGSKPTVLFLHGFGGSKEDYADFSLYKLFEGHGMIAYDAPGCGETTCSSLDKISIHFLVKTARAVLDALEVGSFHLVGHSMGGLTALLLADQLSDRVLSFTNIKGNLAPEDCFLSRQILTYSREDAEAFLDSFVKRAAVSPALGSRLFAVGIGRNVRAKAVKGIFESMVALSDHEDLIGMFLRLPCERKTFMFGEEYASLSYLPTLAGNGIRLAEISHAGHFPMYSNPVSMWDVISDTISKVR